MTVKLAAGMYSPVTSLILNDSFASSFKRSVFSGALVTGALALTPVAHAQKADEQPVQLSPVTVQGEAESYQAPTKAAGPKMTAPLLDTPRSVITIPQELIKDRGAASLQDVLRTTPGITLGSGEGGTPTGDRPFIRGYEASTDMFIDGVRDYARGSHETFNLESVEVLKGPSSAYTGRGGTGGSINLVTKAPKNYNFFETSATYGTGDQWRTTIDGNYAFSETGALRLNLMKMGGKVAGRDGVTVDRWGIAPSLAFGLGTPTRVTLSYSHIENKDMPDLGIPFKNSARPGRLTPPDVDRSNFYGRRNVDFRENVFDTATAEMEHDLSDKLTVRNVTRYGKTLNHYLMTRPSFDNCSLGDGAPCSTEGPGAEFTRKDRASWRGSESLVNQTDIFGEFNTGSLKHSFSAGLEFSKEDIYTKKVAGLPYDKAYADKLEKDSLYNPNSGRNYTYNLTYGVKDKVGDIKTSSVYLFDTIEFSEAWSANLGLRYDNFKVADHGKNTARSDGMWNYQLGLVYKPAANGSIYVSYGTSSNPSGENLGQAGGADGISSGANVGNNLAPEKSRSWEIGTKWDVMDERLSLTAAIFQTDKTNARTIDPITGDASNDGSNQVRGLELGVSGAITPKWNVWAGYSYLDPKVKDFWKDKTTNYNGKQMKFIAKQNLSLWSTYKVMPKLTVGGGATYMGKRFVDDGNDYYLPSYWRYDAMARYEVNKNLSFQLNANNLSNNAVYDASHVGIFANVGAGRSYMLTATYRYE